MTTTHDPLVNAPDLDRVAAEDFLFAEATLLDQWDLEAWLDLFAPGATYEVPTPDAGELGPTVAQYFVADDTDLLRIRVNRLLSRNAHAERPRSTTHRMITNVVSTAGPDGTTRIRAAFQIHRVRDGHSDPYLGWYDHLVVPGEEGVRFVRRRSVLAGDQLRPGSRLSFIL